VFMNSRDPHLSINGERLWKSLADLAKIGATPKGGVKRIALTPEDKAGRDAFVAWCRESGLTVTIDQIGNIFARRAGSDDSLPPVMSGSHLDTQPSGGRFDGAYGVMAALEVCRALNDLNIRTRHPIEVAVWTNEEGTRFTPVMEGSGVFAGKFALEFARAQKDVDGVSMGDALDAIGYAGAAPCGKPVAAYFEAHIEQGPVLENEGKTIGVVTGGLGQRWFNLTITGMEAHAGPTPMALRRDALQGATVVMQAIDALGRTHADTRATVGFVSVHPNSRNVIPGRVAFSADLRAATAQQLDVMEAGLRSTLEETCKARGLTYTIEQTAAFPPTPFDPACMAAVSAGAERSGYSQMALVSGAGHDAIYLASVCPTAMIFVPCKDGISHNEIEDATPADLEAGCNVLLHAMLERAGRAD
jgi:beta-ureidopropionase / N-carbamoyl-L-amino-acid hydrolase